MAKKKESPIGFGRKSMPEELDDEPNYTQTPPEPEPEPPLVEPIFVDDVEMHALFKRYCLTPLAPVSRFEFQLVQICAALEKRVRELDPDL